MTRDESDRVLMELLAGFPGTRVEQDTPRVWHEQFHALSFDAAIGAARDLIGRSDRMPSIAQMVEATQQEARRLAQIARPALPAAATKPATSAEKTRVRDLIEQARAHFAPVEK